MGDEHILKYVIIGDSGSGKSSFLNQYMTSEFDESMTSTVGVEFYIKRLELESTKYKLHIWDLAGQDRFKTIARSYYRKCDGVLLMFDLSNRLSFDNLNYWYREIENMYDLSDKEEYNPSIFVIGNKNDMSYRDVEIEDVEEFIGNKSVTNYMECSAKTGNNVSDIFNMLNQTVHDNVVKYGHRTYRTENTIDLKSSSVPNEGGFNNVLNSYCCYY